MKKIILTALLTATIISCGDKKKQNVEDDSEYSNEETVNEEVVIATGFKKGADLIAASDCLACHRIDEKLVGPSYKEIAAKYTSKDQEVLIKSIIEGGSGKWGEVPMTAHPDITKADATEMVKYILSTK
jgi:cytochrome c